MAEYKNTTASAKSLLKDLREIISKKIETQTQFDKIVALIAKKLHVSVCSLYILRPGDMLELFATKGLDPRSVHETFLRVGEGLIGEIALQRKALTFDNAWEHPSFVYKPETKEKAYKSLFGVPVLRNEDLLGVLAVQTGDIQSFSETLQETLITVSMALAEFISAKHLARKENPVHSSIRSKVDGVHLIDGIAVGQAVLHQQVLQSSNILAKDSKKEIEKLNTSLKNLIQDIENIIKSKTLSSEQEAIFEAYLAFTQDKGWFDKIVKHIEIGLTAETSIQKVNDEMVARMLKIQDSYIRERAHDLTDLSNRLIKYVQGKNTKKGAALPQNTILVAHSMGPAELLDYDTDKIKALVLEEGSQTMHVVIVARSLNIPVLGGIKNIFALIHADDELAVDATGGFLYINPSDEILDTFTEKLAVQKRLNAQYQKMQKLPGETVDGVKVALRINAGLSSDLLIPEETYYDGVGLYRTELPFMTSEHLPDIEAQTDIYHRAILSVGNRPIMFRTLDIGSDKVLPYFENKGEQNPAMGWRSIRITLDRRAILRGQLRAFLRASKGKELHIMFPMIASANEFLEAKKTLNIELERERAKGNTLPCSIKVGTMLEVPSLIFQLPELLKHVDFVSIGTNDLAQFLFATDRGNPLIWDRYDTLSPMLLRALKYINECCQKAGKPCSVCGEMASKPLEAMTLVGLGFTSLSMTPSALGAVKAVVRSMNQAEVAEYIKAQLDTDAPSLRDKLKSYAMDHNIFI